MSEDPADLPGTKPQAARAKPWHHQLATLRIALNTKTSSVCCLHVSSGYSSCSDGFRGVAKLPVVHTVNLVLL